MFRICRREKPGLGFFNDTISKRGDVTGSDCKNGKQMNVWKTPN